LAGVGVNLFFMIFFGIVYTVNPSLHVFQTISIINGLLTFFSLLPLPLLEGAHVFTWSIWVWVILMFF